jgi:hypothetical protein
MLVQSQPRVTTLSEPKFAVEEKSPFATAAFVAGGLTGGVLGAGLGIFNPGGRGVGCGALIALSGMGAVAGAFLLMKGAEILEDIVQSTH